MYLKCKFAILTAGAMLSSQFLYATAHASVIQYSWSGRLVPTDDASPDPWQIGEQGKPFELTVAVSRDAPDSLGANVEFAAFSVDDAHLRLQGEEIPFQGNGTLDFTDNSLVQYDLLVFTGHFERLGHAIEIQSGIALALTTFQFSQPLEPPPFFSSTVDHIGGAAGGPVYSTVVSGGTLVNVVPEPASTAIFATATLLFIATRRSKARNVKDV